MGFRFRKSVKLMPGVRLNVGKRGLSLSAGVRGASVTLGSKGLYGNVSLPGTGISYRTRLDSGSRGNTRRTTPARHRDEAVTYTATLKLQDDGRVEFCDQAGNRLPPALARLAKQQQGEAIRAWLSKECDRINSEIEALLNLHLPTPSPTSTPKFVLESFNRPQPQHPELKKMGLFVKLLPPLQQRIVADNHIKLARYETALEHWKREKAEFGHAEATRLAELERKRLTDTATMASLLTQKLETIAWPRETNVDFEIADSGKTLYLDVDLPEIEALPGERASLSSRGWQLSKKPLSETTRRQHYLLHIHAIGFRLIGEVFATLPSTATVVLSAYSQRLDKGNGRVSDEYLYSVKVDRARWSEINFSNLVQLDIIEALARFEIRRQMTKTGIFTPIEPFERSLA